MKKVNFVIVLSLGILFLAACNNSAENGKVTQQSDSVATKNATKTESVNSKYRSNVSIFSTGPKSDSFQKNFVGTPQIISVSMPYDDSWDHIKAKDSIDNYFPAEVLDDNNAFAVDVSQLNDYVTKSMSQAQGTYVHFLLAYDDPEKLLMVVSCINNVGDDIYYQLNATGDKNVLKLSSFSTAINPLQDPGTTPPPTSRGILRLINALFVSDANAVINNYLNDPVMNQTATTFLVDAPLLSDYLGKCKSAGVKKIHLFLGEDNDKLVLIIAGFDGTKYIYFNDGNNNSCVFEHCYPCPICNINNKGVTIEN